jgi:AraC family transcriptional regulator
MTPRIVTRPALHLVGMRGRFTRETTSEIPALWGRFVPRMGAVPRRRAPDTSYGVCAAVTDGSGTPYLEYTACVETDAMAPVPEGMTAFTLPAATYAVFTHTGPIGKIGATWDAIHHGGVAAAGLVKAEGYDFEQYDARWDPKTGEGPVDIHVAIRPPSGPTPQRP